MKVNCDKCGKVLSVPDEKIPPNKKVSVSCPSCKNKISVERPSAKTPVAEEKENAPEEQGESVKAMDPSEFVDGELEVMKEGAKTAMVCDTVHQEKIIPVLKKMGYQPNTAASASEAIGRMKFTQYDLVILAEDFDGSSLKQNHTLKNIQPMPMATRRKMFVALLGKDFNTVDNMQAFALSVNAVINFKDVGNLAAILKKIILENDTFYKTFKEALVASGKN